MPQSKKNFLFITRIQPLVSYDEVTIKLATGCLVGGGRGKCYLVKMELFRVVILLIIHYTEKSPNVYSRHMTLALLRQTKLPTV